MKNTKKKLKNQSKVVKSSFQQVDVASSLSRTQASLVLHSFIATFPGSNITKYSGLNTVAKYMNRQRIVKSISSSFPTEWHNATKFGVNQVLMAITLASISGINRICRIAVFSGDGLVKALLRLDKVLSHYLSKNLIITNFTIHLKLRLDVQAPPLSQNYNSTGRLFQIEIHFKL